MILGATAVLILLAALGWAASRWAEGRARAVTDDAAATLAANHTGLLASELEKFRLLPVALAEYPDVAAALSRGERAAADRLNRTLELLARRTNAAAIYAVDRDGRSVAASNWRLPTSFVGQQYGFRPYFAGAMRRGTAEVFALGTVSGRPGLYLAQRVERGGRALGIVVVKVEFDRLEAAWARSPGFTVAADRHGIVLVTSRAGWRFRALGPVDAATVADARRTLQFGTTLPARAPLALDGSAATVRQGRPIRYRVARVASPLAEGNVLHFAPLAPARDAARLQAGLWALGLLLLVGVIGAIMLRSAERRRLQHEARATLEREVANRTADLREADRRYRAAREELALASRLGSLGQITAGVAHEINQPVAAIRTFAENGAILLDRQSPERARENLTHIVGLTERIGAITAELRGFARRNRGAQGTARIGEVIDGLSLLMGEPTRGLMTIDLPDALRHATVAGDRIRLEQILVNLTQNALDAVAGLPDPALTLDVTDEGATVVVRVTDNGGGIDPAVRDTLFTPFTTAKPKGLGLGLAIARDIAREFGGELAVDEDALRTTFVLTVRKA